MLSTVTIHTKVLADSLPRQLTQSDYHEFSKERAEIGQFLFYDKILLPEQIDMAYKALRRMPQPVL